VRQSSADGSEYWPRLPKPVADSVQIHNVARAGSIALHFAEHMLYVPVDDAPRVVQGLKLRLLHYP
jgi:hypothetical protein